MENIPADIISHILSRVPVVSVLECRRVRKAWRTLTYQPSFASMHLHHQLQQDNDVGVAKVAFISLIKEYGKLLYHGEYGTDNDDQNQSNDENTLTVTRIKHPRLGFDYDLIGSCNGLICLSTDHYEREDPVYICNPITRECINIPVVREGIFSSYKGRMVTGFGYDLVANAYKVVRIYYDEAYSSPGRVCVYTLGDGTGWRNKGEITYCWLINTAGVFVNGGLHWFDHTGGIVAFDVADEEFRVLPPPPYVVEESELVVLGGCLCLFHYTESGCIDIWSFKKCTRCNNSKEKDCNKSWSWTKEHSITIARNDQHFHEYRPFAYMKNGEVLLWSKRSKLARYDPMSANFETLVDYGQGMGYQTITHMNSFVSLKSIGEDAKIIG